MRVRCHRIIDPVSGNARATAPYLRIGGEYDVLELTVRPGGEARIRLLDDDSGTPSVWPVESFEITTAEVSPNWAIDLSEDGIVRLAPPAWLEEGFWEDFFDGKPEAVDEFARAVEMITGRPGKPSS